jgi:NTE family protein
MRALDIATDQSRSLRKRRLIDEYKSAVLKGAYWGIDTAIEDYKLADALPAQTAIVEPLARIRTRLDPFTEEERGRLINFGYALADAAVRKYAPHLIAPSAPPPGWPRPAFGLG